MEPRKVTGPAMADRYETDLLAAIEDVTDPDEAENLIKVATIAEEAVRLQRLGAGRMHRWAVVRLRAERKWGELLGPAGPGGGTGANQYTGSSPSSKGAAKAAENARRKAREVYAVDEQVFEHYVMSRPNPSRAGLLRGSTPKTRRSYAETETEALRKEIRRRLRAGKKTDFRQLMDRFDMGQGFVQQQIAIVKELMTAEGQRPAGSRAKNWNGKTAPTRQRELKESARASDAESYLRLMKMQTEIWKLCSVLENFRIEDLPLNEVSLQTIIDLLDDLISLGTWHHQALASVSKWVSDSDRRRRIEALRNTDGRQPEEVKAYLAMADKLERKLLAAG